MYQLHYFPSNANGAPHVVLEEFDQKYDLVLVDRAKNAQKSKHYLKINPNGRIPTLVDGDLAMFEAAAIVLHLVDQQEELMTASTLSRSRRPTIRPESHRCSLHERASISSGRSSTSAPSGAPDIDHGSHRDDRCSEYPFDQDQSEGDVQ
jgi:hypothetical protein